MAQIALTIAGRYVGARFGVPNIGAWIGATIGGEIDRRWLFPSDTPRAEGPRLEDLHVQISSYGAPVNRLWGTMRLPGNIIWAAPIREVRTEEEQGGDGCGGGPTIVQVTYTYFGTFAIAICEGPVDRILRIWADTKLIYNLREENTEVAQIDGLNLRIYTGDEIQSADPTIESFEGEGNVPAHKGLCYVVFNDFPLEKWGNRIPNFTFEVAMDASDVVPHLPLEGLVQLVWGSDAIVFHPDELHVTIQASGYWDKVNVITHEVVYHAEHLRAGGLANIPHLSDFDIDENNIVHTTHYCATPNQSYLCALEGDEFILVRQSAYSVSSPWRVRVFRTPAWPYVVCINSGGSQLIVTHRYDYELAAKPYDILTPPSLVEFASVDFDEVNGIVWAVCKDWINVYPKTTVEKVSVNLNGFGVALSFDITADIQYGKEIMYDPDTNQVIVGSTTPTRKLAFYNADDMSLITILEGEVIGSWAHSAWRRGAINGYLHFAYSADILHRVDIVNHVLDRTWHAWPHPGNWHGGNVYDPLTHSVITGCLGDGFNYCQVFLDRGDPNGVPLSEIVSDICEAVGLDASDDLDVSELTDMVYGYVINERMKARAALQPLMNAYFFDGVESDGKLKFPKRGGEEVVAIPETDLAAHTDGQERPQELVTIRQQELELPREIDVIYIDPATDYMAGIQRERRLITQSKELVSMRLPIAMDEDEAKQIAVKLLAYAWMQRTRHQITIPREYSYLDPADVVTVTEDGNVHTVRIEEIGYNGGALALQLVNEQSSVYVSDAEGTDLPTHDDDVEYPGLTVLVLIDCPLLKSTNNEPGMYVATLGYLGAWSGAVIFKSADGGATWDQWIATTKDAIIGKAMTALGDVADPWLWDEGGSVNVRLLDTNDVLSGATELEVLNGANAAYLGEEVIQWKTATLESNGTYTLSGLLRGRKGSEWATGNHAVGEDFVLLNPNRIHFVEFPVDEMDQLRVFKVVSMGMRFASGTDQQFTCELRNMMPLSAQHVQGARDDSNNLTIGWIRRTRYGGEWNDEGGVPLGETTEAYEIDILDGDTVVRTITGLSSPSATYTAAQQTADGFTPGEAITLDVYQVSSVVGRGFATRATV